MFKTLSLIYAATIAVNALADQPAVHLPRPEKAALCQRLVNTYNHCQQNATFSEATNTVTMTKTGKTLICDDGLVLPFLERLRHPDVSSTLSQIYPVGPTQLPITQENFSPGGIRNQDFTKGVYGNSAAEVETHLVHVELLRRQVLFNSLNGAAHQLSLVNAELRSLYTLGTDQKLNNFLRYFMEGACAPGARCAIENNAYEWRVVAGTTTLSNHSFGTAIDIQPASDPQYWLWDINQMIRTGTAQYRPGTDTAHPDAHDVTNFVPRVNASYPAKMVEVFERHGFIWGGKWYRYDIMHFEFRPEFFPNLNLECGG